MKRLNLNSSDKSAQVDARILLIVALLCGSILAMFAASPVPANKPAAYPAWWFERDVISRLDPENSAPICWTGSPST